MAEYQESVLRATNWPSNKEEYDLLDVIGKGRMSITHKAFCKTRNEICSAKRIDTRKELGIMSSLEEVHAMRTCNHENIMMYNCSFIDGDEHWLITNFLRGGSLHDIIYHKLLNKNCIHGVFKEATVATVLKEVSKGLEYLHSKGRIHRDIKDKTIYVGECGSIQIGDLGFSLWISGDGSLSRVRTANNRVGSPCWMAPEIAVNNDGYDFKVDIWGVGILALLMITGILRYKGLNPIEIVKLNLTNDPPTIDSIDTVSTRKYNGYGKLIKKMIADCLQKDPTKRPSASELLKHPFFEKAKDKKYLVKKLLRWSPFIKETK